MTPGHNKRVSALHHAVGRLLTNARVHEHIEERLDAVYWLLLDAADANSARFDDLQKLVKLKVRN
jgi:hypothetical protein